MLVVLGTAVALFLTGGGLERVLRLFAPLLQVAQAIVVAVGMLLGAFGVGPRPVHAGLTELGEQMREAVSQLGLLMEPPPPMTPPEGEAQAWLIITRALQVLITVVLPVVIVSFILIFTWRRMRQRSAEERSEESRESLLSAGVMANSLQSFLQDGLQRLGELAGLVRRLGPAPGSLRQSLSGASIATWCKLRPRPGIHVTRPRHPTSTWRRSTRHFPPVRPILRLSPRPT